MTARRAGTLAAVLVAAGVLLAVLLVTWAASIGPNGVLRGDGPSRATPTSVPTSGSGTSTPDAQTTTDPPPTNHAHLLHWVAIVLDVAAVVVVVGLLALLLRWLARTRRVRRARRADREALAAADFNVIEPRTALARELLADAGAQRDALADGTPRNAVVACWHRFELAATAAGVERHLWETSSEHTIRVLDLVDSDPASVSRLAALYREARFSEHELSEADRAAAVAALDEIHRGLGVHA